MYQKVCLKEYYWLPYSISLRTLLLSPLSTCMYYVVGYFYLTFILCFALYLVKLSYFALYCQIKYGKSFIISV